EDGKWVSGATKINKILYRLPELISSNINEPVFFVEGEKDVENVRKLGFIATTFHPTLDWPDEYNKYFINRKVIFPPDNDDQGRIFSSNIAKRVSKVTSVVKWLKLPGLKESEDVSDWIERGGSAEELKKLAESAPDFSQVVGSILNDDDNDCKTSKREYKFTKTISKTFNPRQYTELIIEKFEIKSDMAGRLWFYDRKEGIWKDNGEDYLKSVIRKDYLIRNHIKNNYVNEIIADIKQYLYEGKYFDEPPAHLIAFNNKIYDLKNDRFLDFDPKFFFMKKISVNTDTENKSCPLIDSMFEEFVGHSRKIDLYELAAYCLYRKYPNAKFFLLAGDGRNGKSTYINLLEMLLGRENVTSVNLKNISSDRFSAQALFKKLLSISFELDNFLLRNTSMLKQLTGRDLIRAEKKFKDDFQFENYAKIVVVANAKLTTTDKTVGFSRRAKIINFIAEFEEEKKEGSSAKKADTDILEKISKAELEGFAHVCLETLKELYKKQFVFSITQDQEEVKELYDKNTQILNEFLKQNVMLDPESYIFTVEFYEAFTEYLRELKVAFWSEKMLIDTMESIGYERKQKRIVNDGLETSRPCWPGFKWN
ncbi:MAG: phage/plasmid primase, P4 family, partial [Actinobacteria bacterium]|nr:phage/plasmid primase, P4 family [Actinomycetota bacterium]